MKKLMLVALTLLFGTVKMYAQTPVYPTTFVNMTDCDLRVTYYCYEINPCSTPVVYNYIGYNIIPAANRSPFNAGTQNAMQCTNCPMVIPPTPVPCGIACDIQYNCIYDEDNINMNDLFLLTYPDPCAGYTGFLPPTKHLPEPPCCDEVGGIDITIDIFNFTPPVILIQ